MGTLFTALRPNEIKNPGERAVAHAMVERMSGRVEVVLGFNWLSRGLHGTILEGECRFVLLDWKWGGL